jgi:peroxiredoxin
MKKTLVVLLTMAFMTAFGAGLALGADEAAATEEAMPRVFKVGDTIEGLTAMDSSGTMVDLVKALGGKDLGVVVFMNTACSACLSEVNMVNDLYKQNQKKMEMVVVSVDFGDYSIIENYKSVNRFYGNWLQDKEFAVPTAFGFSYTPAMAVIDKAGKVLYLKAGFTRRASAKIAEDLTALLN